MDKSKAALGSTAAAATCIAVDTMDLLPEDRIFVLEEQMKHMLRVITRLRKEQHGSSAPEHPAVPAGHLNKDGIPIGTVCYGVTEKSPLLYYLTIETDGYAVGAHKFQSLSAAAEAVSMVRRSGWTFWRLLDGRSLKEVYKD